jgi:hypothetical protein
MVAETLRHVRGRLRHRSGPEPIGCTAESNQPYVLPLGAGDTRSQIAGPDTGRLLFASDARVLLNAWRGPKAMDSVLADLVLNWSGSCVGSCHVDPASTCTSRDFNERSTQLRFSRSLSSRSVHDLSDCGAQPQCCPWALSEIDPGALTRFDPAHETHFRLLECFRTVLAVKSRFARRLRRPLDCSGPF